MPFSRLPTPQLFTYMSASCPLFYQCLRNPHPQALGKVSLMPSSGWYRRFTNPLQRTILYLADEFQSRAVRTDKQSSLPFHCVYFPFVCLIHPSVSRPFAVILVHITSTIVCQTILYLQRGIERASFQSGSLLKDGPGRYLYGPLSLRKTHPCDSDDCFPSQFSSATYSTNLRTFLVYLLVLNILFYTFSELHLI